MTAFIENIFSSIFGNNVILATIIIAMVPMIELKGAIPFSMSQDIWGASKLSLWQAFGCGLLGSSLLVPLLALLYTPIIRWLKTTKVFRSLAEKIENKINSKKENIEAKSNDQTLSSKKKLWAKIIGVFLFVAIPLPLTGVWTGTCLAVALGLGFWTTCATVIVGNTIAGLLITLISSFFGDSTMIFVYIFLAIILLLLIFFAIRGTIKNVKKRKNNTENQIN